jgi:AcrR family transcriptional regulator
MVEARKISSLTAPAVVVRKSRADGVQSRQAILAAAADLATVRGLEGLSIGELAKQVGMSKSGLYAHFKSKEELELATIDTAARVFQQTVLDAVPPTASGLDRIHDLTEAFLSHLARRVFAGGCFFAAVGVQLAPRPGPARNRVMQFISDWNTLFSASLKQAQFAGHIAKDANLDQLAFEITAMLFRANFAWVVSNNPAVLDQARTGIQNVLKHAGPKHTIKART